MGSVILHFECGLEVKMLLLLVYADLTTFKGYFILSIGSPRNFPQIK